MEEKVNKLTCKKLPEFIKKREFYKEGADGYIWQSEGILKTFEIKFSKKHNTYQLYTTVKAIGQFKTFEDAVEFANKFNQDDYSDLCAKIIQWEAE